MQLKANFFRQYIMAYCNRVLSHQLKYTVSAFCLVHDLITNFLIGNVAERLGSRADRGRRTVWQTDYKLWLVLRWQIFLDGLFITVWLFYPHLHLTCGITAYHAAGHANLEWSWVLGDTCRVGTGLPDRWLLWAEFNWVWVECEREAVVFVSWLHARLVIENWMLVLRYWLEIYRYGLVGGHYVTC